jgi:hypothetical protein
MRKFVYRDIGNAALRGMGMHGGNSSGVSLFDEGNAVRATHLGQSREIGGRRRALGVYEEAFPRQ